MIDIIALTVRMWIITGILLSVFVLSCTAQDCPAERRIEGFQCAGSGFGVADCPSGSRCMRDARGSSFCCWDEPSSVEAPCEDPLTQGSVFLQCTPGDRSNSCPGRCYDCQMLPGTGVGLCCPQVNRQGCENSSPMRNAFEAARQRIAGSGSSMFGRGSADTTGGGSGDSFSFSQSRDTGMTGGFDSGAVDQFSGPALAASQGQGQQPGNSIGMDFGMTVPDSRSSASRFIPASEGPPSGGPGIAGPGRLGGTGVSFAGAGMAGRGRSRGPSVDFGSREMVGPGRSGGPDGAFGGPTGFMPGITGGPGGGAFMSGAREELARRRGMLAASGMGGFPPISGRVPFRRRF